MWLSVIVRGKDLPSSPLNTLSLPDKAWADRRKRSGSGFNKVVASITITTCGLEGKHRHNFFIAR